MGNAAMCKACGADKTSKSTGSNMDLNQQPDYYGAPDSDDAMVRNGGGERETERERERERQR